MHTAGRIAGLNAHIWLLLTSLTCGCLLQIRPAVYGRLVRPGASVAGIRIAVCSMTPARGWKCRSLTSTQTDADGRFEFDAASALFPLHNLPCGERAVSLVAVCHSDASRFRIELPPESPNAEPVRAFDDQLQPIYGRNVRQYHSPQSICQGMRLLPQPPDTDG